MKKFNVAKSVESEKKKSPPEKKIFYSLIMCVFAIALFTSFFSGKMEKKINEAAKNVKPAQTEPEKVREVYIPPESKTDIGEAEAKEEKSDVITIKPEVEAPAAKPEAEVTPKPEITSIIKPVNGEILKLFSDKTPVYSKTMGDWRVHDGIDISAKVGDSVFACANGVIEDVFDDKNMGTTVIIDHGSFKSKYQNLSPNTAVQKGVEVKEGDTIGVVGDSAAYEIADAPHLHFELYEGNVQKNPEKMFK
ncbi:MAG: M23 family metallopeptidase [Clostridia bacterium]|nr:M23 family metallopeptidase [Clostridia bacterium]